MNMKPIGTFKPEHPFFLAPLAGITDVPTRILAGRMGASLTYTEMVSAKGLMYQSPGTESLLRIDPEEKPVAIQIFGGEPEAMAYAARSLAPRENVILDINMGCPVPKVAKNGEGAALMKDPVQAAQVIRSVVSNTTKPVTVKIRSGWDADSINAPEIAWIAQEEGAAAVAVHGRTRMQYYTGEADWELIGLVKHKISVPVIGSGDVFTPEDAVNMLEQTGCDYVMIARGALGNPWIFRDALALLQGRALSAPPSWNERIEMMLAHLDLAILEKGEKTAVLEMRKHAGWYLKGMPGAAALRREVNKISEANSLHQLFRNIANNR